MTCVLGLTGCIGMGKSATARIFAEEGCAVWDSDAAVHSLYAQCGAAVAPIAALFPSAVRDGAVSRSALRDIVLRDTTALKQIEDIVHPLVTALQQDFVAETDHDIVVLDIPLLFETGREKDVDAVIVVSVDAEEQQRRLDARGGMTAEQLRAIREKQLPDVQKRARADHVVITDTPEHARAQVEAILRAIRQEMSDA